MTTAMIQFLMQMEQMLDLIDQILDALEADCLECHVVSKEQAEATESDVFSVPSWNHD